MTRTSRLAFLIYAATAMTLTFTAHASLYLGFHLRETAPTVWLLLHLSILVSWAALIATYRSKSKFKDEFYTAHSPVLLVFTILFILFLPYAMFNFFYSGSLLHEGYLGMADGQHVILLRSQPIMVLNADEWPRYELIQARRYSGHWMICHLIPCIVLYMDFKWRVEETA